MGSLFYYSLFAFYGVNFTVGNIFRQYFFCHKLFFCYFFASPNPQNSFITHHNFYHTIFFHKITHYIVPVSWINSTNQHRKLLLSDSNHPFLESKTTVSICCVNENISHPTILSTLYLPPLVIYLRSLANVSGPQDIYTIFSGESLITDDINA